MGSKHDDETEGINATEELMIPSSSQAESSNGHAT